MTESQQVGFKTKGRLKAPEAPFVPAYLMLVKLCLSLNLFQFGLKLQNICHSNVDSTPISHSSDLLKFSSCSRTVLFSKFDPPSNSIQWLNSRGKGGTLVKIDSNTIFNLKDFRPFQQVGNDKRILDSGKKLNLGEGILHKLHIS